MKCTKIVLIIIVVVTIFTGNIIAATYDIPHGGISDHSNASTTGSIAWYMSTYGSGNTYNLSSNTTYYCSNTLFVPVSSTLGEKAGVTAVIRCMSGWYVDSSLISLNNNWACVRDLELHGDWKPMNLVWTSGKTGVSVRSCTVHKSKKANNAHLIVFYGCNTATITGCLMRRAACNSDENNTGRNASGIYAPNCDSLNITWNNIAVTSTHGVNITSSTDVYVAYNYIHDTGRANGVNGYAGDGITGYHNSLGYTYLNWWIENNDVWGCRNHGIHVSGRDVHVENNDVWSCKNFNVMLADWRRTPGYDCSSNCTIKNNFMPSGNGIRINEYKPNAVAVSGNIGPGSKVQWGSNTCN
jgi:hypothetical protein